MLWFADIAASVDAGKAHVINDSKTPSGRVHVGALRGVILHDAVFRALKARGVAARYLFGVDDYDPLDEIPKGQDEHFSVHLGKPLCDVPPPPGSTATDMAEHFISEFFDIFNELGVEAERYRMRDHYRAGRMNESIDRILAKADVVRQVYKDVSGSVKSEKWHPFQVVCERCGRLGTTEVIAYDGKEVEYHCRPNLVKWAKGCGNHGKMSPFDGRGKMPWKLEWVAKWRLFGVTIEGAGKDHTTKGGARDVSNACLQAVFNETPPLNIPYEFFLAKGKKMSSSKGVGSWARDMADFLAPEVLRYLILRNQPPTPVDFPLEPNAPDPKMATGSFLGEEFVVKLFNDFDRLKKRVYTDPKIREDEKELYRLCEIHKEEDFFDASFQLVLTFVQMPHVDLAAEMEKRKGAPLTDLERRHLEARAISARYWLKNFAREEEKTTLQEQLPARAEELSQVQRGFMHKLADAIRDAEWKDDVLQAKVFDTARRTPIAQAAAFQAIYRAFLDKASGPPAGALMAVLPKEMVLGRLTALPYDEAAFWQESKSTAEQVEAALAKEKDKIAGVSARMAGDERAIVEVTHQDGKVYVHRLTGQEGEALAKRIGNLSNFVK
jgi:lysyl-tRNA synthetase class 1